MFRRGIIKRMSDIHDPQWHVWDDAALRVLHDRAQFAKKTERADAIATELIRR